MTPSAPSSFSKTRVVSMSGRVLITVTCTPRIVRWPVIKRSFAALTASLHQPMSALLSAPRSAAVGCFCNLVRCIRGWDSCVALLAARALPVSHSRVEQVHRTEEDRVEHVLEQLPRHDQPKQAERAVAPHEHPVLPGGVVAQENGHGAAAVERGEGEQIERREQQVE